MASFKPFRIFTPSPILGYGFDSIEFWDTIRNFRPTAIILDSGSTDPGPYLLGTNKTLCSRQSYIRDLEPILEACWQYNIKLLISSAGGAGTNEQVDFLTDIISELAKKQNHSFKLATIKFSDTRDVFIHKYQDGSIHPCSSSPPMEPTDLRNSIMVVAQMGAEPFREVLKDPSVSIIIAGRSYDPSPFAAFCMHNGVKENCAWHVGKIIECGGLCTVPKGRSILATMYQDSFVLTPTNAMQKCTPVSVAAHTLYEKTRPDKLPGPGGVLHLDGCTYALQSDGRSVLVKGSKFVPSLTYQVKLEGVQQIGYRTCFIGGIRDPILISRIRSFLDDVIDTTKKTFSDFGSSDGTRIVFHIYGLNAVMGDMEPETQLPHEIGLLGEVIAETQDQADAIAGFARTVVLHGAYEGQLATGGNLALPLTPLETPIGPVFKFSVYHLMDIEDPIALFPIEYKMVGRGSLNDEEQTTDSTMKGLSQVTSEPDLVEEASSASATQISCNEEKVANASDDLPKSSNRLKDLARVIRSKNAGPFEISLDVLFESFADFHRAESSNVLNSDLIQRLYKLRSPEDVVVCMFYKPALAWKCTFKRYQAQGSVGETDTFGAQMHAPLLGIEIPVTKI